MGWIRYQPATVDLLTPVDAQADAATVTFDQSVGRLHTLTLGGNRTLALVNDKPGQEVKIVLTQDGTGSRTVTWFSGIRWAGGSAPTLTATANKSDVVTLIVVGAGSYLGTVAQNF